MADAPLHLDYEATLDCVHCGLCLTSCPTYQETGSETSSPRGRIYLMRGVAEGRVELTSDVVDEMYLCLACRACESACPAGVRYGSLVESMRAEIDVRGARSRRRRFLERLVLRRVIAAPRTLRLVSAVLRAYQRSGLEGLLRRTRLLRASPGFARAVRALPPLPDAYRPPILVPARSPRRGRVALFSGCVMRELFGGVHRATVRVLAANGFEVEIPRGQVCCGALHLHSGDPAFAERLRRRNRSVFRTDGVDAVVVNSAGCGTALRDADDDLARSVRDVSEFLVDVGLRPPSGRVDARVAYDDPCHLLHGQRVARAPRQMLGAIPGLRLFDLPGSSDCCGAAGTYALTHSEMSDRLLGRKVDALRVTAPDVVTSGNPGCLMQLWRGVSETGLSTRVVHPVELLDQAYGDGDQGAAGG